VCRLLLCGLALLTAAALVSAAGARRPPALATFSTQPANVGAGDEAVLAVHVTQTATCTLRLSATGQSHVVSAPVRAGAYAAWTWTVPLDAALRTWTDSVVCAAGKRKQTLSGHVGVGGAAGAAGGLVLPKTLVGRALQQPPARVAGALGTPGPADSAAYPDANAPCTAAPFASTGACSSGTWGYRTANGVWNVLGSRGFPYRSSADFVAWALGLTWSSFHFSGVAGTAADWKTFASAAGMQVVTAPAVGDIAWWGASRPHPDGVVGLVVGVDSDGAVVESYGFDDTGALATQPVHAPAYLRRAAFVAAAPSAWAPGTAAVPAPPPPSTAGDAVPPTLPPTAPIDSFTSTPSKTVTWPAATDNVGVAGYLVSVDGTLVGSIPTPVYTLGGLACSVRHTLTVSAYDFAGNVSAPLTISGFEKICIIGGTPPFQNEQALTRLATYSDYHGQTGPGPAIESGQTVEVSCWLRDGATTWYRILSAPWGGAYYADASGFFNSVGVGIQHC